MIKLSVVVPSTVESVAHSITGPPSSAVTSTAGIDTVGTEGKVQYIATLNSPASAKYSRSFKIYRFRTQAS